MDINISYENHSLFLEPPFNKILVQIGYGKKNSIFMKDLAEKAHLSQRDLRKAIEHIRRSGIVILSGNAGYYFPSNKLELIKYIKQTTCTAKSTLYTLKSARSLLRSLNSENRCNVKYPSNIE